MTDTLGLSVALPAPLTAPWHQRSDTDRKHSHASTASPYFPLGDNGLRGGTNDKRSR